MLRDSYIRFTALLAALYLALQALPVQALTSDRDEPATIDADQVEFDFRTGKRTYTGNVVVVQGTLKVTGDKLVVQYDDQNVEIETATSWGNPATFKQRPDGKEDDVYGEGDTIILNQLDNTLTLIENALLTQAGNTAKGVEIVYHMDTDKMTVKGLQQEQQQQAETAEGAPTDAGTGRAHVTIKPEEQPGGGSSAGDTGGGSGGKSGDKKKKKKDDSGHSSE